MARLSSPERIGITQDAPVEPDGPVSLHTLAGLLVERRPLGDLFALPPDLQAELCDLALAHEVAPYLYDLVQGHADGVLLAPAARERLLAAYGQAAGYSVLALTAARLCSRRFSEAGIEAIWFKGLPLGMMVYPSPAARPMVDIDVLVDYRQLPEALALLSDLAGQEPAMLNPDHAIHAVFNLGPAKLVKLELHWGLIAPVGSSLAPPVEWFLEQAMPLTVDDGNRLSTLQPEAHLLYLCAHAELGHGESQFRLLRYLDLHLLLSHTEDLQWDIFLEQAVACRWSYAAERALTLAQHYFQTPLPDWLIPELSSRRLRDEDVSFVLHTQMQGSRWTRTRERLRSMPRRRRLHLLVALLAPPAQYIRWRYDVQKNWQLPFYYAYRWYDALRDMLRGA